MQVLCQYMLRKADHAYFKYLMLQQQLNILTGRKLDHGQVQASHNFYVWLRLGTDSQNTPFILVSSRFHGSLRSPKTGLSPREMCSSSRCPAMDVPSDFTLLTFGGDVTLLSEPVWTTGYKEDDELMN
jgi:hypothetical protein